MTSHVVSTPVIPVLGRRMSSESQKLKVILGWRKFQVSQKGDNEEEK